LFGTLAASVAATVPRAAEARDYREALARKEARKAQLKEAAEKIKSTGKPQEVFKKES
jgi:hypothetical protein